ncbi:MBL fold metallo-hydrolase [Paenibacillus barcinonensis]|uniref:Beta-casp domain-containing protein n=1 Tax=Paenibacillus barcinonensis TaxID=198119 RepID=A0A2V4V8P8_PAEBA|nr:MBL fold metallo-hydrolase [Paenibacillus barcinonensis]PYE42341.1 beta-casp domain-containing protein [Paenibacillus barcinonensis]QKS58104.1 MBL fold metallo-hydrolase [Paenibacillus barcinonensis]
MIKLNVWGGAGEHGRSAYLLSGSQYRLLLDCGVKKEGSGEYPLIEPEVVPKLDAVLLSHAHEDHSVAIPLLYKLGYQGEVWTTRETKEQLTTYFRAWRNNMERAGHILPYDESDEQRIRYQYLEDQAKRGCWFELLPGLSLIWGRSGHLAGSVWFGLEMEGKRILYSGDYTSESMLLQADDVAEGFRQADREQQHRAWKQEPVSVSTVPRISRVSHGGIKGMQYTEGERTEENTVSSSLPSAQLDLAIIDAAYGTDRDTQADKLRQLERVISKVLHCGGKVLLPVPAVGRGQELILWTQQRFPDVSLIVEQKLVEGMEQLQSAPDWLIEQEEWMTGCVAAERISKFLSGEGWNRVGTAEERSEWLEQDGASIWFIPDGMMQSSLARWYYGEWASDVNNMILLTGHTARGTFAYQLLENPQQFGICQVQKVRYKVHQGWQDVEHMMKQITARHNVLVHTDYAETERLRAGLLGGHVRPRPDKADTEHIALLSPGDELMF